MPFDLSLENSILTKFRRFLKGFLRSAEDLAFLKRPGGGSSILVGEGKVVFTGLSWIRRNSFKFEGNVAVGRSKNSESGRSLLSVRPFRGIGFFLLGVESRSMIGSSSVSDPEPDKTVRCCGLF